jgi:uncharacterized protein
MPYFAVEYTYDDRSAVRDRVRAEHRRYLAGLVDRGILLCSGPFTGPPEEAEGPHSEGALLLLAAGSAGEVAEALDPDPFAREGLVARRSIRPWQPVLGQWS